MQEIAVARHDLDTVGARLTRAPRGMAVVLHEIVNLGDGHAAGAQSVEQIGLVGCAHGQHADEFLAREVALPAGKVELNDVAAIVFVNFRDERTPRRDRAVVVDARVPRHGDSVRADARIGRNNRADAAAREVTVPGDPCVGHGSIVVVDPSSQAGADNPVLESQPVDGQRLKDGIGR